MAALRDQIWAALNDEFRSTAEVAERAGVDAQRAAPALAHMRRAGGIECCRRDVTSFWRRSDGSQA
jgi:hypothetical protein